MGSWRAAGVTEAIRLDSKNLPAADPFYEIDPLLDGNTVESQQLQAISSLTLAEKQKGYSQRVDNDSDDPDWKRSAFETFNEMDE